MQFDMVGALGEAGHPVIEPDDAGIGGTRAVREDLVQIGAMKLRIRRAV